MRAAAGGGRSERSAGPGAGGAWAARVVEARAGLREPESEQPLPLARPGPAPATCCPGARWGAGTVALATERLDPEERAGDLGPCRDPSESCQPVTSGTSGTPSCSAQPWL